MNKTSEKIEQIKKLIKNTDYIFNPNKIKKQV